MVFAQVGVYYCLQAGIGRVHSSQIGLTEFELPLLFSQLGLERAIRPLLNFRWCSPRSDATRPCSPSCRPLDLVSDSVQARKCNPEERIGLGFGDPFGLGGREQLFPEIGLALPEVIVVLCELRKLGRVVAAMADSIEA